MPYATAEDLARRLAPELLALLADEDADGTPDAAILDAALRDASNEIDRALADRYAVPLDPAPPIVARWCADLAVERLLVRRRQALTPEQAQQAALARRALEAIATGAAGLAGARPRAGALAPENVRRDRRATFEQTTLEPY